VIAWAAMLTLEEALASRRMARRAAVDVDVAGGEHGDGSCHDGSVHGGCGGGGGGGGGEAGGSSSGGGGGGSGSWASWGPWRPPRGAHATSSTSSTTTRQSDGTATAAAATATAAAAAAAADAADCDGSAIYGSGGRGTVLWGGILAHVGIALTLGLAISMPWAFACSMPMAPARVGVVAPQTPAPHMAWHGPLSPRAKGAAPALLPH